MNKGVLTGLAGGTTTWQPLVAQRTDEPTLPATNDLWIDTDESAGTGLSSILAYADVRATQGSITTEVDLTGLTVTVTVPDGRRLRITSVTAMRNTVDGVRMDNNIKEGATVLQRGFMVSAATGLADTLKAQVVLSPTAGTHTYKVSAAVAGAGTATMDAGSDYPAYIMVEDITGTLWPAGQSIGAGSIASEAWTTFVPTLTQGATVTKNVDYASYVKMGRRLIVQVKLSVTGAGTAANDIVAGLPLLMNGAGVPRILGSGWVYDSSANVVYKAIMENVGAGLEVKFRPTSTSTANDFIGSAVMTAALAVNDLITYTVEYETAT